MKNTSTFFTFSPPYAVLLAATSIVALSYEILLMRLLSIGQWHHFAYMVISMALLGFGASGSILFLVFDRIKSNVNGWLIFLTAAAALSFSLAFSLSQKTGLDPLQIIWQPIQWIRMMISYILMSIPFLLSGGIIGIILTGASKRADRMYAVDLLGAGFGALIIVPALYMAPPWKILPILGYFILLGGVYCCLKARNRMIGLTVLLISALLINISNRTMEPVPKIHDTKGLPMTLNLPDSVIEATINGPLGIIHVVGSSLIRNVPGLSLNFGQNIDDNNGDIPEQKAIFVDADSLSPITSFKGSPDELEYLDYTSMALPYHVRRVNKMLAVGVGGGTDILLGIGQGVDKIIALEANHQVAEILLKSFSVYSGELYSRPDVKLEVREARQFLHSTEDFFDLIQLSMTDSFVNSAGGLHSASESYLYTSSAFREYISHLSDSGILSITRWLKLPPRDSLRILSTALSVLEKMDISDRPEDHVIFIRSWKTCTIILSKKAFSKDEILEAKKFCDERSFDISFYGGMDADDANKYDVLKSPIYYEGAKALFGPDPESFMDDYLFDISPTDDDRPFFSHFFKWDKAPELYKQLKGEWLPMMEMGYIFIMAALVKSIIAGSLLILLPLIFLKWVRPYLKRPESKPRFIDILGVFIYFGSIGLGFMFMEMALLARFTLLLAHPVYSASIVLATVLVFAGFGSLFLRRIGSISTGSLLISTIVIISWGILHALAGNQLFNMAMGWPLGYRIALSVAVISVPSFFLGWFFPSGLCFMSERWPGLVPWAWGINGCASVIGAVSAKCLAIGIGLRLLIFSACFTYSIAVLVFYLIFRPLER